MVEEKDQCKGRKTMFLGFLCAVVIPILFFGSMRLVVTLNDKRSRSDAYVKGYVDMFFGHGVPLQKWVEVLDKNRSSLYYRDMYKCVKVDVVTLDRRKNPCIKYEDIEPMAYAVAKKITEIDPSQGQLSEKYLGGTEEEFQDYYQGGMKFLADLDAASRKIKEKWEDDKNRKKLIEARRKGLAEINQKTIDNLKALDDARAGVLSGENWDQMMKEVTWK